MSLKNCLLATEEVQHSPCVMEIFWVLRGFWLFFSPLVEFFFGSSLCLRNLETNSNLLESPKPFFQHNIPRSSTHSVSFPYCPFCSTGPGVSLSSHVPHFLVKDPWFAFGMPAIPKSIVSGLPKPAEDKDDPIEDDYKPQTPSLPLMEGIEPLNSSAEMPREPVRLSLKSSKPTTNILSSLRPPPFSNPINALSSPHPSSYAPYSHSLIPFNAFSRFD